MIILKAEDQVNEQVNSKKIGEQKKMFKNEEIKFLD